jgi:guanine deaminase
VQHAPQYPNIGLGSDLQLLDWLERVTFPAEAKFEDLVYAKSVYEQVICRTLSAGVS